MLPAAALLVALGVSLGAAAQDPVEPSVIRVEPETPAVPASKAAKPKPQPRASHRAPVELPAPSPDDLAQLQTPRKAGVPQKIGFSRPIGALGAEDGTARHLQWETLEGGALVAAISVTSPEAAALRFGLRVRDVPPGAAFRFYDPAGEDVFEVSGAMVLATIAANVAAGETGPEARTYWSPVVESSTAVLEIELPPGSRASELRMSVPQVSHLVTSAKDEFLMPKAAASCELDAMCQQGAWGTQMNAVARLVFSSGGSSFLCSGTLLADSDTSTTIPYLLTANHCINAQTTASTLATYWFWRSTACNSGVRGPFVQQQGGATLLYHSTSTDVSFVQLNTTPPAGAAYAGWIAGSALPLFSSVTGLHHPTGDLLKISTGSIDGYITCSAPTSTGQFSCSNPGAASSTTFYDVAWSSGVVEGGSSGSALFDNGKYVVGQLYGGSSSCSNPAAGDSYGRFDVSYRNGLSTWLGPLAKPPQALNVGRAGAGLGNVASVPAGIDCGAICAASFAAGSSVTLAATPVTALGSTFAGWSGACTGTGTCTVKMDAPAVVTATFNQATPATVAQSATALMYSNDVRASQVVTFTNQSTGPITFNTAALTSARYSQANNCGVVSAGGSCSVTLGYDPANAGSDSATFTLTSTASNSPHVVALVALAPPPPTPARLSNISARGQVLSGNEVMIGGFVIGGATPKTVVVRARGPSLAPFGIANALANPTLQLVRSADQSSVASNDNWGSAANAGAIAASGFAPSSSLESAVLVTLGPGAYTAVVAGAAGSTGVGMVEVFEVDRPESPLANISVRGQVMGGDDAMIGGFVVAGSGPQAVLIRARGPSLVPFGIANALGNPTLQLVRSADGTTLATNDDWAAAPNATSIAASGFAPGSALESAILVILEPGAYTAILRGAGSGTGVGIIEVFAQ